MPVSRFNDYIVPSPTKDVVVEDELWDLAATASDHADSDEVSLRGASKVRTIFKRLLRHLSRLSCRLTRTTTRQPQRT